MTGEGNPPTLPGGTPSSSDWQEQVDRQAFAELVADVAEIKGTVGKIQVALIGLDGRSGALAQIAENTKRLNAGGVWDKGNALYASIAAAVAALVGWFGGARG